MHTNPQRRNASAVLELCKAAGRWLKEQRERCGLSQRQLADKVGAECYTFISQLEMGRGRVPPDKYRVWSESLGLDARDFVLSLLPYYDPVTYGILFPSLEPEPPPLEPEPPQA
jgi:transcriptional regulator with XRE-family HTH domain